MQCILISIYAPFLIFQLFQSLRATCANIIKRDIRTHPHKNLDIRRLNFLENVRLIEICITLCARLDWPRIVTRLYGYECIEVCVCAASRKTDECNYSVGSVVWKMVSHGEVLRRVQMYIDEDPGNP